MELGFPVEIRIKEVDEIYQDNMKPEEVPEYLACLKASPLMSTLDKNDVLITADTLVIHNNKLLGKPIDSVESVKMLSSLSNSKHEVITGVSICTSTKQYSFSTKTDVFFSALSEKEIKDYVESEKPFDKAGSYGIQEWIGYIGVEKIIGCYYNVMGLPLHDIYKVLKKEFPDEFSSEQ